MTTWTFSNSTIAIVVTADNVDLAIEMVNQALYVRDITHLEVKREDLIPLPTHHRHIRTLWFEVH